LNAGKSFTMCLRKNCITVASAGEINYTARAEQAEWLVCATSLTTIFM
jgi:hypothetical protein